MNEMQTQQPAPSSSSNNKTIIIIVSVVIVVGLLGMFGRGFFGKNATERAIERATGGNVDVDYNGNNTATYKTNDGSVSVGENVSLPSSWPSDVSIMRGAKINYAVSSNPSTGSDGAGVMYSTTKSASEVIAYYKIELPKQGWTIGNEVTMAGASMLSATKDKRSMSVSVGGDASGTSVTIGVSK